MSDEKLSHLPQGYLEVIKQPDYDSKNVKLKIDINDFSHFNPEGFVYNVHATDLNFPLDKERKRVEEYMSAITIPYKTFNNYLNKKSNLYSSLIKSAHDIKN